MHLVCFVSGHPSSRSAAKRACICLQRDEKGEEQPGRRWMALLEGLGFRLKEGRGFLFNLITPPPREIIRKPSEVFYCLKKAWRLGRQEGVGLLGR